MRYRLGNARQQAAAASDGAGNIALDDLGIELPAAAGEAARPMLKASLLQSSASPQ